MFQMHSQPPSPDRSTLAGRGSRSVLEPWFCFAFFFFEVVWHMDVQKGGSSAATQWNFFFSTIFDPKKILGAFATGFHGN